MSIPGFNAERALFKSSSKYVTSRLAAYHTSAANIIPQQTASREDLSTCCGHYCPDRCYCEGGIGFCLPSVVEGRGGPRLSGQSRGAIDYCESGDHLQGAICSCGCVAGPHYAYCLECHLEA